MLRRRRWTAAIAATVTICTAMFSSPPAAGAATPARTAHSTAVIPAVGSDEIALVRLRLPSAAMFDELVTAGADIANRPRSSDGEVLVDLVASGRELAALTARGAVVVQLIQREGDGSRHYAESQRGARISTVDTLHFLQAYWWTTGGQAFVQTQVATTASDDPDVEITVTWRTADGTTGSYPLFRIEDADEYQYHVALPQPVPARPVQVTATSSLGGVTRPVTPAAWPGVTPPAPPAGYQQDFIDAYLTPVDIQARIRRLARQFPNLVEVIDLPNKTQGYRRTAAAYLGDPAVTAIVVESVKFGDQNVNGFQVVSENPGAPNRPLSARIRDRVLTVSLATDATGAAISTTDQVAGFISARYPQRFSAFVEDGSAGLTMPVAGPVTLSDGLRATAGVPRRPWTVQALRIGLHRDGSRVGVLAYSQEHAREWVTPLATLEFAERMLVNYATDAETRDLLDKVDIFVVPTVNPDGANYSFNDFNFQRRNIVNHCVGAARDPRHRNRWGVDVNRNYGVGSMFDGYDGASANCLSDVYAGTGELSEAESSNVVALADAHPNIRFSLNVHSFGGYFMWPPGAYRVPGRITLPRPSIEEAAYFLASAKRIVAAIASSRGTVTWPTQTGPVADVLYSAAGNSADHLYYANGIVAWNFEVGNDLWNPTTGRWQGVGFQPAFPEAHAEALEYATGIVELIRIARDFGEGQQ